MKKILITLLFAFVGLQNAWSGCAEGVVYFQIPETWSSAYAYADGKFTPFVKNADGWWTIKSETIGQGVSGPEYAKFFISEQSNDYCIYGSCVTSEYWDQRNVAYNEGGISCVNSGNLYVYENPKEPGKTEVSPNPPDAKYFFVMIPPDMEDWMADLPMLSFDGGKTGKPLTAVADMCGWYSYIFWNEEISDNVVLYRDGAAIDPVTGIHEDLIGLRGNWEDSDVATPIPMGLFFGMGVDSLFFVPDEDQKTNEDGFYFSAAEIDGIEGTCSYSLAAIIYDTDALLHPSFSCYSAGGEGCQFGFPGVDTIVVRTAINACIGVTPGIVESTLDPTTKKPKLAKAGEKCFINEKFFNQLFNYTEGVNEKSCFDMPFWRSQDGKWEFDSDH